MSDKLKPCPFCGASTATVEFDTIECGTCFAEGPWVDSGDKSDFIAAWNRRATHTAVSAEPAQSKAEDFCDGNCTWLDHHPSCIRATTPAVSAEPVAEIVKGGPDGIEAYLYPINSLRVGMKLYPTPPASEQARDATRYRWLRDDATWTVTCSNDIARFSARIPVPTSMLLNDTANELDAAIDAAMKAKP